ncbi:WD repeat-containing and planar cell polarity effector protein fritz isoform X2 [Diachasmimorpha longicaudata]|uniref:WD repeat-containing and planar cell polarity effector protein fritz isoform X2 n=1 Tax=Diachasmimorpha longicaudata TaxID=58733 RepID=UPI0030B89792
MFALLSDIKLWSCDDNIDIKDTDFGAFRYNDRKTDGFYNEGKRSYCNNRGIIHTPVNKKGKKLKDGLKYLEEQLRDHSIIYSVWHDQNALELMLNTGLLIFIQIKIPTGDIDRIGFDKYLVGKVPDHLSDAVITRENLVCTQNDSQVTILHFTKSKRQGFEKISKLEPKLVIVELSGPSGRRIEKKIRVNRTGDLVLIWWKSTSNEVYPWSPAMKEHDRANVHLYRLRGVKFELLCYIKTEFDPLCVIFNSRQENVLHSVEQKVSRKGEVTIEWQTYQVSQQDKLQRIEVVSIPLPTHTSCSRFSPNQDMLLLCCIDGSITLHDHTKGTNASVKAGFIPTLASWHSDSFIFTVGNERGQCQHYDISLTCIKTQMLNEESTQSSILDLTSYFRSQPALLQISWCKKLDDEIYYNDRYKNRDSLLFLSFERGPLGVMRIVGGSNLTGDVLVFKYLSLCSPDRATSLLLSMNWDSHPRICMHSLNQILNHLFKLPLVPERESLIQDALGGFHVPVRPISQAVEDEYGDEIKDLTRRFFHHLMRYKLFEKAFRLAIDLNDHDLFMDIHYYALVVNDVEMARAAKEKAELVLSRSNSCASSHSTCSRPSCSLCSDSPSDNDSESYTEESGSDSPRRRPRKFTKTPSLSQIPPLPIITSGSFTPVPQISTSFNDPPSPKKYLNILSKPFDYKFREINPTTVTPNKNTFSRMSTSFAPQSKNHFPKMSTSFGNLKISELQCLREPTFRRAFSNDRFLTSESQETDKTGAKMEEVRSVDIPNSIEYSFMSIDTNLTSTSFISEDNCSSSIPHPTITEEEESKSPQKSQESVHLFNSENLVSTSFNDEDPEEGTPEDDDHSEKDTSTTSIEVPPPPEMTSSLANYLSSLPMKNLPISRSTPGLSDINELMRFSTRSTRGVQTQSSVSAILQNRGRNNFGGSGTYRFNYDLGDEAMFTGSCEDLRRTEGQIFGGYLKERARGEKIERRTRADGNSNVPPLPVVGARGLEGFGERPKVKFSNTVTHILVPGSGQGYRPLQRPVTKLHPMDPKRELAESLPLCLGNEDYLKDFQPLSNPGGEEKPKEPVKTEETAKIKVVHFGLL